MCVAAVGKGVTTQDSRRMVAVPYGTMRCRYDKKLIKMGNIDCIYLQRSDCGIYFWSVMRGSIE